MSNKIGYSVSPPGLEAAPPMPNETCDRCTALAVVAVELTFGRLVFCRHDFKQARTSEKFNEALLSVYVAPEEG